MPAVYALAARWLPYLLLAGALVVGYWYITADAATDERNRITTAQQVQVIADQDAAIVQLQADAVLVAGLLLDATNKANANAKALSTTKASMKELMSNEPCRDVRLPTAATERLRQYTNSKD